MSKPERDTIFTFDIRKVIGIGHSLGITLPPHWLNNANVLRGDAITITLDTANNTLILRKLANGPRH